MRFAQRRHAERALQQPNSDDFGFGEVGMSTGGVAPSAQVDLGLEHVLNESVESGGLIKYITGHRVGGEARRTVGLATLPYAQDECVPTHLLTRD